MQWKEKTQKEKDSLWWELIELTILTTFIYIIQRCQLLSSCYMLYPFIRFLKTISHWSASHNIFVAYNPIGSVFCWSIKIDNFFDNLAIFFKRWNHNKYFSWWCILIKLQLFSIVFFLPLSNPLTYISKS